VRKACERLKSAYIAAKNTALTASDASRNISGVTCP
jgi:hypothetical protein